MMQLQATLCVHINKLIPSPRIARWFLRYGLPQSGYHGHGDHDHGYSWLQKTCWEFSEDASRLVSVRMRVNASADGTPVSTIVGRQIWTGLQFTSTHVPKRHLQTAVMPFKFAERERSSIAQGTGLQLVTPWSTMGVRWKKKHVYPPLDESEIEESFMRGSGPGGQAVAKTHNCVQLKHLPTGIVVKCHETRSLEDNRKRCRYHLQEKLDRHFNGDESFLAQQERELRIKKAAKKQRTRKKLEKLKALKEKRLEEESEERETQDSDLT